MQYTLLLNNNNRLIMNAEWRLDHSSRIFSTIELIYTVGTSYFHPTSLCWAIICTSANNYEERSLNAMLWLWSSQTSRNVERIDNEQNDDVLDSNTSLSRKESCWRTSSSQERVRALKNEEVRASRSTSPWRWPYPSPHGKAILFLWRVVSDNVHPAIDFFIFLKRWNQTPLPT